MFEQLVDQHAILTALNRSDPAQCIYGERLGKLSNRGHFARIAELDGAAHGLRPKFNDSLKGEKAVDSKGDSTSALTIAPSHVAN